MGTTWGRCLVHRTGFIALPLLSDMDMGHRNGTHIRYNGMVLEFFEYPSDIIIQLHRHLCTKYHPNTTTSRNLRYFCTIGTESTICILKIVYMFKQHTASNPQPHIAGRKVETPTPQRLEATKLQRVES